MSQAAPNRPRILALSGGVGGAKLVLGLARILAPKELMIIANSGDDFEHLGLKICPDLDTVVYTLAGLANPELGWGREAETWSFMSVLRQLGGEDWFNLGDGDLALHVMRTQALKKGATLSQVTKQICARFAISATVLPMSDDPVATMVETAEGLLPFQHYFVRDRCQPTVSGFQFVGLEAARGNSEALAALSGGDIDAVIVAPSNPFVSVDPILGLSDLRAALATGSAPVIAVSPIVGGLAIKGPAAKMMAELGLPVTALAVAEHYQGKYPGLLSGFVIDRGDGDLADGIRDLGLEVLLTQTIMGDLRDREELARACLRFADELRTKVAVS